MGSNHVQTCLSSVYYCEDHFHSYIINRDSHIWFSYIHRFFWKCWFTFTSHFVVTPTRSKVEIFFTYFLFLLFTPQGALPSTHCHVLWCCFQKGSKRFRSSFCNWVSRSWLKVLSDRSARKLSCKEPYDYDGRDSLGSPSRRSTAVYLWKVRRMCSRRPSVEKRFGREIFNL